MLVQNFRSPHAPSRSAHVNQYASPTPIQCNQSSLLPVLTAVVHSEALVSKKKDGWGWGGHGGHGGGHGGHGGGHGGGYGGHAGHAGHGSHGGHGGHGKLCHHHFKKLLYKVMYLGSQRLGAQMVNEGVI